MIPRLSRKNISVFGVRAVGKTAYLIMLVNRLSNLEMVRDLHILEGMDYYMKMMEWIQKGEGPPPTKPADRVLLHIRMRLNGKKVDIKTLDVSGFDVQSMGEAFKGLIEIGDGYIFLIEPTQDPERRVTQVWLIYKLVEYITSGFEKDSKKPLAITFTKNDLYNVEDPEKFFVEYTRPIYNLKQILNRIKKHSFFAVSAYGGDLEELRMRGETPNPVEVEKPFLWIIENS